MHQPGLPALCPSSYHHSLQVLRWAATLPWLADPAKTCPQALLAPEARELGLHGLKSCLLAAAAQLRLPKDDRLHHGHHRDSARLYSRDDTIASLFVQEEIRAALLRGWRPQRSQARGGQAPVPEPPLGKHCTSLCTHALPSTVLSDPSLRRWVTRLELLPTSPAPAPPAAPHTPASAPSAPAPSEPAAGKPCPHSLAHN